MGQGRNDYILAVIRIVTLGLRLGWG